MKLIIGTENITVKRRDSDKTEREMINGRDNSSEPQKFDTACNERGGLTKEAMEGKMEGNRGPGR